MSEELPQDWVISTFGEISDYIQRGKSPKYTEFSELPVINQKAIRWDGIIDEYLKYIHPDQFDKWDEIRYIQVGDILWNSTGTGTIGRACIVDEKIAANRKVVDSHVTIVRPSKHVDPKFVFYWIKSPSIQNKIDSLYSGSTNQVELSKGTVLETEIPLPPLPEQKLIADKLDCLLTKVDTCKARLDKVPEVIKRFRQSVLADATSGRLTEDWREQNQKIIPIKSSIEKLCGKLPQKVEANLFQDNKGIILPKTWELVECLDICQNDRGVRYGVIQLGKQNDNGKPILRSSNVRLLKIELSNVKRIDPKIAAKYERTILEGGEVLVTIRGTLGGVADVPLDLAGYNVSREVAVLPIIDGFIPRYISFVIGSIWCQNWLSSVKKGVAYVGINLTDLKKLPIPLPPIEEQKEIVKRVKNLFSIADQMEEKLKMAKTGVEKLTVSILAKAFRGELVPQDFNDKPVEKL